MATEPFLNKIERDSALWKKIQAHLEARLQKMRESNDLDKDEVATAKLRGRIKELKHLAALGRDPQVGADDFA